MAKSIATQLRDAWVKSEMSLEELGKRAKLGFDIGSLSRKLSGKQILTTDEAQVLARVLGVRIVWPTEAKAS